MLLHIILLRAACLKLRNTSVLGNGRVKTSANTMVFHTTCKKHCKYRGSWFPCFKNIHIYSVFASFGFQNMRKYYVAERRF